MLKILKRDSSKYVDIFLILLMSVLAGCGIIYQYLLSDYAGRVLGMMEHAIFTMTGIMIVSMGIGAFLAQRITNPYNGFAILEFIVALLGSLGILIISGIFALNFNILPIVLESIGVDSNVFSNVSGIPYLDTIAHYSPYGIGLLIGIFIGMEIPLISYIRQDLHRKKLAHNLSTLYGADYLGAGLGSFIFVIYILSLSQEKVASVVALLNLLAGLSFLIVFRKKIRVFLGLLFMHLIGIILIVILIVKGNNWQSYLENSLYKDTVVYSLNTSYQHVVITKRKTSKLGKPIYYLYLNGHTQFSSDDEFMYHELLVYPAVMSSARHDDILIIGGGDGLAVKQLLKFDPRRIDMLELDENLIKLFTKPVFKNGKQINKFLLQLNAHSFSDKRVNVKLGDAYNSVDILLKNRNHYDTIVVDLPDPSNPNLNKLYSVQFYSKLYDLLSQDGAIVLQSTSPYFARLVFLTIAKTLKEAGFSQVEQYHHNIPSFGEWGFTIGVKQKPQASKRILSSDVKFPENSWLTKSLLLSCFEFGRNFFAGMEKLKSNTVQSNLLYSLHSDAWINFTGIDVGQAR